jgi:HK97 gp10 family phage protein
MAISITGVEQVKKMLEAIPADMALKIEAKAMRKGAQLLAEAVKQKAPQGVSGDLKNSIVARKTPERYKGQNTVKTEVAAKRSKSTPGGYYAHLPDLGHKVVVRKGGFKVFTGTNVPGQEFRAKAVDENRQRVISEIESQVSNEISKYNKKL